MVLPGYIIEAARGGTASDLETIKDWLDDGGDVDDYEPAERRTILKLEGAYSITRPPLGTKAQFVACKKMIADERRRRYMVPRKAFLRLRSLVLRGRAEPDSLLAAVARLPNEMAWHVLSFWPAEADVAPPSTPSPRG